MNVLTVALDNINRATAQFNSVAARIAKLPDPQDNVDLSAEMVNLMQAGIQSQAGDAVFQTADQLTQSLLDVVG
jgi:flagellin-like hook-associated protein FlgL